MPTAEQVYDELKQVYDPEIPVNIVDLGLIYDVQVDGSACKIKMTLTSQACPSAQEIPDVMRRRVNTIRDIESVEIDVVWEPQWTPHMITAEGKKILGIEEEEGDDSNLA